MNKLKELKMFMPLHICMVLWVLLHPLDKMIFPAIVTLLMIGLSADRYYSLFKYLFKRKKFKQVDGDVHVRDTLFSKYHLHCCYNSEEQAKERAAQLNCEQNL